MTALILASLAAMHADTTGRFISAQYDGPAGALSYMLYVPTGYDAREPVPLVVALHGCTQGAADFAAGTRLNEAAERETFLVVYPEQAPDAHPAKCWNWYEPAHQARGAGEPALMAEITREIQAGYAVDGARTFIVGISAGAALALHTVVAYPELYHAAALHSGVPYAAARSVADALLVMSEGAADPLKSIEAVRTAHRIVAEIPPIIVFHGATDAVVAPRNAEQLVAQWTTLTGVVAADVRRGTENGYHVVHTVHRNASGRGMLELWLVEELGHAWSGGSTAGTFTDPAGPDATSEIIRFFLSSQ